MSETLIEIQRAAKRTADEAAAEVLAKGGTSAEAEDEWLCWFNEEVRVRCTEGVN